MRTLIAAAVAVCAFAFPSGALAQGPDPILFTGNPSCADIDQQFGETWLEYKIEPVRSGTTTFDNGDIAGSITVDGAVRSFSFQVLPGVDAVIVKGGPDGNAYVYDVDATSGSGLHAPDNGGQPYGLSHISFCYDLKGSISGTKWHDLDADGVKDADEPVLAGWKFYLDLNNDGDRDAGEPIATTDAAGLYSFTDLAFGTYTVRELPASEQPNTALTQCSTPVPCRYTFTLTSSNRTATGNFGNYAPAKLTVVKQTDPDGAAGSFTFSSTVPGNASFSLSDGQSKGPISVTPGTYTATESVPAGWSLKGIVCTGDMNSSGSGTTATFRLISGEDVTCTFTNRKIIGAIQVVKSGTAKAHHGDQLSYTFAVTNVGNSPLHDVVVSDDKCSPVTGPVSKTNDDGDALLEPIGADGVNPEVWNYTCSYAAPAAHADGEVDPIHNIATATGKDDQNKTVTDTDDHDTVLIHPDIELDKKVRRSSADPFVDGPITAAVGDTIEYEFTLSNAGDTELAVDFSDPKCDAGTLGAFSGDGDGDGKLDVTETWVARCTHVLTVADGASLVNVAAVTGTDSLGGTDTDSDTATVTVPTTPPPPPPPGPTPGPTPEPSPQAAPAPTGEVLPEAVISGVSRLAGPSGCVTKRFTARVTGRRIKSAVFSIDGKVVKRFRSVSGEATKVNLRVNPARYGRGSHRLTVRVTYNAAAKTAAKTLRMTFARCASAGAKPRFTG